MGRFESRESQDQQALQRIDQYRIAAHYCLDIKPILAAFDGNVYNCRLEKALQEKGRIYCEKNQYFLHVYAYCDTTTYNQITLPSVPIKKALSDGKRINAAALIEAANIRREELLRKAYSIEKEMPNINQYQGQIEQIKALLEGMKKNLPDEILDIYGLNYYVKYW